VLRVGIDIGGTFTDLVAVDDLGNLTNIKIPTEPRRPELSVIEAVRRLLKDFKAEDISMVTHGTTIATNALFGQLLLELPKTVLITTRGFRDVIEIGRQNRPELYNVFFQRPRPIIPRRLRYEVEERIGPKGEEIQPVNLMEVKIIAGRIKAEGVESVAIGLMNCHKNPSHEEEITRILRLEKIKASVTTSSEVSPEYREYERMSTTVVNAVLIPIVQNYVGRLLKGLEEIGVESPLYIMQSNGGLSPLREVKEKPVCMVESGPASGVIATAFYGSLLGDGNVISLDVGGTTAKAGAVKNGKPEVVMEYEVGGTVHKGRIVKGSGYPVRLPFIDLAECGTGGGTIAWIDDGGSMKVGPTSAGAVPGPACYGTGGENPTITDANLILGRIPDRLLGGAMKLYPRMAENAVREKLSEPLGLDHQEAASNVVEIANSITAKILKIVSVERGHDPRDFSMIAFGGAGPMHACALAEELQVPNVIIPESPGLFSALGLLVSDVTHNLLRAVMNRMDEIDPSQLESVFKDLEDEARRALSEEGFPPERMVLLQEVDARYVGQSYEITVPMVPSGDGAERLVKTFHERHGTLYGYMALEEPIEIVNARLTAKGLIEELRLPKQELQGPKPSAESLTGFREVYFESPDDYVRCPIYARERLSPGNRVVGPLVVEQYDSTTVVYPDWSLEVDCYGNLRLTKEGRVSP